jgi:hypothetical protein
VLPLIAIGGVIGAVMSVAKGASWLSDQLDQTKSSASAGGKAEPKTTDTAKASPFAATLAAQVAGQSVPVSTPTPVSLPQQQQTPDYDTAARIKAGLVAYGQIGEHRTNHAKPQTGDTSVAGT